MYYHKIHLWKTYVAELFWCVYSPRDFTLL